MTKTKSLALVAAVLMAGCSTDNYYGDQSGNYNNSGYYNQPDQYAGQYDQYNDQPNVNVDVGVSFGSFERQLAPYGNWTHNPRWGDVWRPRAAGFRPYFDGYWANTREYGVIWVSNDPWGDVTSHYGRWVFDPRDGWLWVPGYVWGPSWVVWRSGGGQIGWFPMPPDDYYGNGPYAGRFDNYYGYRDWYGPSFGNDTFFSLWIFVGEDRFSDRNYRNYVRPQREYNTIIVNTTEVTNYVTVNNYIVNRSVNIERVERASNRRFEPVEARSVMRRESVVTPVAAGRQIEQRERRERPIPARNVQPQNAQAPQGGNNQAERLERREERLERREERIDDRQRVQAPVNNALERREDRLERREERIDDRQRGQAPVNNAVERREDRIDRRQERIDDRQRVQAPVNNAVERREDRVERREERIDNRQNAGQNAGGQQRNAVQPAGAKPNEAAPVPAGGRAAATTREEREAERNARREENEQKAAERRRNAER